MLRPARDHGAERRFKVERARILPWPFAVAGLNQRCGGQAVMQPARRDRLTRLLATTVW
jgi:hypothetical protein